MFLPDIQFSYEKIILNFLIPAGTSRGFLNTKTIYLIKGKDSKTGFCGIGEATIIPGLSVENENGYESFIQKEVAKIDIVKNLQPEIYRENYPSFSFALEMLIANLSHQKEGLFFDSPFVKTKTALEINGLIWMGSDEYIFSQIKSKLDSDYKIIKMKIGAKDFIQELELLKTIRNTFGYEFELRLDANGAFPINEAKERLERLSDFKIHSIEQPIAPKNIETMKELIYSNIIPIALDEELIGLKESEYKELFQSLKPQFIILKPSLLGGFKISDKIIQIAEEENIRWWSTSALESNYGLSAITQWASSHYPTLPQGLGTGSLYENNTRPFTEISKGYIKSLI